MSVPLKQRDPSADDETTNSRVVPKPRPAQGQGQRSSGGQGTPNRGAGQGGGQRPQSGNQRPQSGGSRPQGGGGGGGGGGPQRPPSAGQRPQTAGQRPQTAGQRPQSAGQRPGGGGGQRYQGGGQRYGGRPNNGGGRGAANNRGPVAPIAPRGPVRPRGPVELPPSMTIRELSEALGVGAADILKELMKNGVMATINQQLDYDTASVIAVEFEIETTLMAPEEIVGLVESIEDIYASEDPGDLRPRPPVVTIMGHVDHGKTKLLDAIRSTRVAEGEAGGITQHIGAYQIDAHGRKIAFLDTPGHEAFTAMRARGAQVTDIVVLVVAADDSVKPQTIEAISHVRAASVPMIVAINKIDAIGANPEQVRSDLATAGVVVEQWGGDVPSVEVSAKNKTNIDGLLEIILLVADIEEFKANPNKPAVGTVIDANRDKSRGVTATALVQNGTLRIDDVIVCGGTFGKIRAMFSDSGRRLRHAEPSTPVEILGLSDVPKAGDIFQVVDDISIAREIAAQRLRQLQLEQMASQMKVLSLDVLFDRIQAGQIKELNIVIKADVQGSIGAIEHGLAQINDKHTDVKIKVIHTGTGAISESDVNLATASSAIIIGFNARPDPAARRLADQNGIDIRYYPIIYQLLEDLEKAMVGMLAPVEREIIDGYAEVRNTFRLPSREVVAGLHVSDGRVLRNSRVRVLRSGVVVHDGRIASLKRFKDDVREVLTGYECGLVVDGFGDVQNGDAMEFYHKEQVERTA